MQPILVTYYSLTGNTRQIAEAVAADCHADIEPIIEVRPRKYNPLGYLRSVREAVTSKPAPVRESLRYAADYEVAVIGTPVWAGRMSSPVRAYLMANSGRFRRLALFCAEGGQGGEAVIERMAELARAVPVARLVVTDRDLKSGNWHKMVATFVATLGEAISPA